jgi:beta-catenin-like protein 1
MENIFEALTCMVDLGEGKTKFIEAEGVELCLIMLRGSKMSKQPTLRLLDHATAGASGGHICQKLVEEGGLKVIFTMFMKKDDGRTVQHLLAIFASMLRLLPGNSAERIRTLAKFVEHDYEKTTKLLKHREYYASKVEKEERRIDEDRRSKQNDGDEQEDEAEYVVRKLDAGLFALQLINVILAWLCIEDDGARRKILEIMEGQGVDLGSVTASLSEQLQGLDTEDEESRELQEMLTALVEYLSRI